MRWASGAVLIVALLAGVVAFLGRDRPFLGQEPAVGKRAGQVPNDWFHRQRAYPDADYSPGAVLRAVNEARALHETAGLSGRDRNDGSSGSAGGDPALRGASDWTNVGPLNIGGRITAVAIHPSVPQRIFAGAAAGGVFRSEDNGVSWDQVFDESGVLSIGAISIDPTDPNRVWVGTGEANASGDSFVGNGVYLSTDAGDTWTPQGLEATRLIGRIAIDPVDPDRVYVAAIGALFSPGPDRGLYRTTNGGANWEKFLALGDSTGAVDVVIDPSDPSRVYAATWERLRSSTDRVAGGEKSGIHRSTDYGTTWTRLGAGLPPVADEVGRIGLAIAPSTPSTVYAVYADDPGYFLGAFRSTNSGDNWTQLNDGALSDVYSSFGWYFGNVRVSPANPNHIYVLGLPIMRSTNGGSTWTDISSDIHVDQHDLWIDPADPARLVAGNDGGVYLSGNGGSTWSHVETLPISQFYAGTIDKSQPVRVYGGLQDNGTVRTPAGALDDWEGILGGDGFYCIVHPTNSNRVWAEWQYGNLRRTTNGGNSWSTVTSGIDSGDRRNWSTPVVADHGNPEVLYYGTYRLYRSSNGGSGWSPISGDLTFGVGPGTLVFGTITTIAVAPTDPQRLYVGTDDARVWTTANRGGAWTEISMGLPNRWVTRIAVDPIDPLIAYVSHSGYREDQFEAHLHRTTNAGFTWTAIDAGLPAAPVNSIEIDPGHPSHVYVATDTGVYVSFDSGSNWEPVAGGLPIVVVHDLEIHAASSEIVAFTHGRSAYRVALPSPTEVQDSDAPLAVRVLVSPNPIAEQATFAFAKPSAGPARLSLVDVQGRLVRTLWESGDDADGGSVGEGLGGDATATNRAGLGGEPFLVEFDGLDLSGSRLAAGVYFAHLESRGGRTATRIVMLPR